MVIALGIVYILSLAVFCVCGFLCSRCTLKHKECHHTAATRNADRQINPPPRYPAPVYEDTKLQPAKAKIIKVDDEPDHKHHQDEAMSCKTVQQVYSTSPKCLAPVYEDVLHVRGEARKKVTDVELQDLEIEQNVAYGPV